jgi:hypothetical protein
MGGGGTAVFANEPPIAEAGLSRYAAQDPVLLDGGRSYDPDASGPLRFTWRQVSGPPVTISDVNSAKPLIRGPEYADERGHMISGPFVQTEAVQECEFELVVGDGELTSAPDTVKVVIVPDFGPMTLGLENPPFRQDRPTVIFFGGGNCVTGYAGQSWGGWYDVANVIGFPQGYVPDTSSPDSWRTYYRYGDMIIVYLSSVAPEYTEMIQTMGWSTGGQPAVDAAIRMNRSYHDPRYAVNHVAELDAPCRWQYTSWEAYVASNELLHSSAVDGEPLRHEHYWGEAFPMASVPHGVVGIYLEGRDHAGVPNWYGNSLGNPAVNKFNHGVVAGAFWSVAGPGRNLQVTAADVCYCFRSTPEGNMVMFDENAYPGRFPEPVALGARVDRSEVSGDIDGAVLTCDVCENAVGYQLLFGSDPHRVADFVVVSDTLGPPTDVVRDIPDEETWWTIRVRDEYGSTIYADPIRLDLTDLPAMSVENARTGKRYVLIGHAIREAEPGDTILLEPAVYEENLTLAVPLTLSSLNPNDPIVVAGTILRGGDAEPTVAFSESQGVGCTLAGLTIQNKTVGVSCCGATPTIRNCVVDCPEGIAVEFWHNRGPEFIDCTFVGQVKEGGDPGLVAYWELDETEGAVAYDSEGDNDAAVMGTAAWEPQGGTVGGALLLDKGGYLATAKAAINPSAGPFSVLAWIKGGSPGQVVVSQQGGMNWLMANAPAGVLGTELKSSGRQSSPLTSDVVIADGNWHRVGFTWDGRTRVLYVDDVEVDHDMQSNLAGSTGVLYIGAGCILSPGSFWSGLIDDVRIYDRPVEP